MSEAYVICKEYIIKGIHSTFFVFNSFVPSLTNQWLIFNTLQHRMNTTINGLYYFNYVADTTEQSTYAFYDCNNYFGLQC